MNSRRHYLQKVLWTLLQNLDIQVLDLFRCYIELTIPGMLVEVFCQLNAWRKEIATNTKNTGVDITKQLQRFLGNVKC